MINTNLQQQRIGTIYENNQGYQMKCVEYTNNNDILIEFQDSYRGVVHTTWKSFSEKTVKNPYHPSVCGVGITGNKYPITVNRIYTKEYRTWQNMLCRCFTKVYDTYDEATCCKEWLLYENFYEWLHSQENYEEWYRLQKSALDKDILYKGNKIYSPDTCCLVTYQINNLFVKRNKKRGDLPIGVCFENYTQKYLSHCNGGETNKGINLGRYNTPEEAFNAYKQYKEKLIKQIAQTEYDKGNITKRCYEAMLNYDVEITD